MPIEITAAAAGANILAHVAEKRLVGRCEPPELHHPRENGSILSACSKLSIWI